MAVPPQERVRKRLVWFSPFFLVVALSPAFFQSLPPGCTPLPPGDTTLSELAVIVGGVEQIEFDANQRSYDVWLPVSADSTVVRAIPTDPSAQVSIALRTGSDRLDAMPWTVGGGEVVIPLEPGTHTLLVKVFPPPNAFGTGISGQYTVEIQVGFCPTVDPLPLTKIMTVGCSRNVTGDVSILDFEMTVCPYLWPEANTPFTAALDGTAALVETFLDAAQSVVPGGVRSAQVIDVAATVAVRSGATGADVELGADFSVLDDRCTVTGVPCTGAPGQGDCFVIPSVSNLCAQGFADVPVIDGIPNSANGCTQPALGTPVPDCDCSVCEGQDPAGCRPGDPDVPCTKGDQCNTNGFCVAGDLTLELTNAVGNYTAGGSGEVILFGWYDGLTPPVSPGLLTLPPAVFADPPAPLGVRVSAGGLFVAFQCLMAVDSGGPNGIATCLTGPNAGLPCQAPANNACNDGTDAGLQCDQSSLTACTFGVPATIGCVNADCGSAGGIAHQCGPTDLASTTPDSSLIPFLIP